MVDQKQGTQTGTQTQTPKPEPTQPNPTQPGGQPASSGQPGQPGTAKAAPGQSQTPQTSSSKAVSTSSAPVGIEKTLEVFNGLSVLAMASFSIYRKLKGGLTAMALLGAMSELAKVAVTVQELITDVKASIPELADIDSAEAEKLGGKTHELVKKVVETIKSA